MRLLALLLLSFALILTSGCSNNQNLEDIEAEEGIIEADTAVMDEGAVPAENVGDVAAQEAPLTTTGEVGVYTVQRGDTLMKVAYQLYGDILMWKSLYNLNQSALQNMNALVVGSQLKYDRPQSEPVFDRNGEAYLIKDGDTLGTIAYDVYGTKSKWRQLYENNRQLIKDPNKIYSGFYLYYQITEEERQQAQQMKAGGSQDVAAQQEMVTPTMDQPSDSAADANAEAGGLDSLAAPPADERTPSSN